MTFVTTYPSEPEHWLCQNPSHDHTATEDDRLNGGEDWSGRAIVGRDDEGRPVYECRCGHCDAPALYDLAADQYAHVDPDRECFALAGSISPCEVRSS